MPFLESSLEQRRLERRRRRKRVNGGEGSAGKYAEELATLTHTFVVARANVGSPHVTHTHITPDGQMLYARHIHVTHAHSHCHGRHARERARLAHGKRTHTVTDTAAQT